MDGKIHFNWEEAITSTMQQRPTPQFVPPVGQRTARLSRRSFLRWGATTLLASGVLISCSPAERRTTPGAGNSATGLVTTSPTAPKREEIQLVYQDWRTDWFPGMVQEMLAQFHEAHPDLRVFFTPDPDNLADEMLAEMEAGTAPDVLDGCCTFFPTWAQQGHMLDLRPYVTQDLDAATIADWDPAQYRAFFLRDGRQFGLPKYHGAVALYYNKDLFDQSGVAYPTAQWDHDDYLAAMSQLTQDSSAGSDSGQREVWGSMLDVAWDRIQLHVNSWGGHLVSPYAPTNCAFHKPKAMAALAWLHDRMWQDRVMATFPDVQYMSPRSAFINKRVAMVEEGSWVLKDILLNADFRVGVAPMPAGPARRATLATSDGYGIYAGTDYPDAAWELVQFLTSEAYGLAMAKANFLQPARASLVNAWIDFVRAEFPDKAAEIDLAAFADGHLHGYSVTVEIAENMVQVQPEVVGAFEKVFTLDQEPVDYLRIICAEINRRQDSFDPQLPQLAE
ncbi:MAG: sugar ABC transporter substrate-binding protein [Caldilineaceae bacterium]